MRFLAAAREERTVRERLEGLEPGSGLGPVLTIASEFGFSFTEDDLRAAHRHDWGLRRMRHLSEHRPADSARSTVAVVKAP